jgi:glutamate racemase
MVAEEYLADLRVANVESLILGCTHYRLIAPLLARIMGSDVRLIDSGAEAARATAELLETRGQLSSGTPDHHFYLSDERSTFARIARGFLGRELPLTTIVDQNDESWFERIVPERKSRTARR